MLNESEENERDGYLGVVDEHETREARSLKCTNDETVYPLG